MSTDPLWRQQLYQHYVTTGQAYRSVGDAERKLPTEERAARVFRYCSSSKAIVDACMPVDRGVRVLDLGCGHGVFLYFLRRAGYTNIAGVDISGEQISLAHDLGIHEARQNTIEAALAATADSSVDVILLMDVLEHLTRDELFDTLGQVHRVLSPAGKCIALVPNAEGLFGMGVRYGDLTHENAFTRKSVGQIFLALGFGDVRCFEEKPTIHGIKSFVRRIVWDAGTLPVRALMLAESGSPGVILSRNIITVASMSQGPSRAI